MATQLLFSLMKKPTSKFGLAALVSQPTAEAPTSSVDALLFAPASATPEKAPPAASSSAPTKTRFTNILPTSTYVQLHQLAFWDRRDMSAIIDAALQEYFASRPDASRPLPEQERLKRKLPAG
jgi:hypothetical protein